MTHTVCAAIACDRPTLTVLCAGCRDQLADTLHQLGDAHGPGLYSDLVDTFARLDHTGSGRVGYVTGHTETAIPYHHVAGELKHRAADALFTWARRFWSANDHLDFPARTIAACADWLATWPRMLAALPDAGTMHDQLVALAAEIRRVIDRAPDRQFLGICSAPLDDDGRQCERDLYAPPERDVVRCPDCGTEWDTMWRRDRMLTAMRDERLTAVELSRALPRLLGRKVTAAMIRGYAHRGRLTRHAPRIGDRPSSARYRVGDVVELVVDDVKHERTA